MESVDANLTQAGSIMGTPHYMAPEQAYGHVHRMGPATDVYSLGTILYELLTGEQPFHDSDILSLLKKIRTSPPARPSRLKAGVPTDLETICLKCLEKKPWDRYATAAALADDLRLYLDGEPIQAKPEGRLKQSLAWVKRSRKSVIALVSSVLATIVLWFFVSSLREQASQMSAKESVVIQQPEGLPEFNVPMSNPLTHGKVELGRMRFFDRRLSLDSSVACVDCHNPEKGWSDASRVSQGIRQQMGTRNSISVANVAYQHFLFWDGRATSLEEQALLPISNPVEMGMSIDELCNRLNGISGYREEFDKVFGNGATEVNIAAALTAFQRTLVAGDSPYDQFRAGDENALSAAEKRGMDVFFNAGHCSACHAGPLLSDGGFHNIGIGQSGGNPEEGRKRVTGRRGDSGSFKTPSLRDLARTAPYMHDGSISTLAEVIEYYDRGGTPGPQLDEDIYPLDLTPQQKLDLAQFLATGLRSNVYPESGYPRLPD